MTNGWNWIEESDRISAEARRLAGLKEEVMAESIVFNCQGLYEGELDALNAENLRLRAEITRLREAQPRSVAALREALVLLGEDVQL